jgi:hypothetical protein
MTLNRHRERIPTKRTRRFLRAATRFRLPQLHALSCLNAVAHFHADQEVVLHQDVVGILE